MNKPACVVCNESSTKYWRTVNNYPLWKCTKCKALFAHPMPTDEELNNFYGKNYHSSGNEKPSFGYGDYEEKNYNWTPIRIKYYEIFEKKLLNYVSKDARLLDLGCATGAFLIFLRDRGWKNLFGVEFSEHAAAIGRKYDLNISSGTLVNAEYPDAYFDVIFSLFVIEHIKEPHGFMRPVYKALKPGGFFVCGTDDFGGNYARLINFSANFGHPIFSEIKPPEHLIMYSKETLNALVQQHGFDTVEISDVKGTRFSDFKYKNPILRGISLLSRPILKFIPADIECIIVSKKI